MGKRKILDAAKALFWANGFEATSPAMIMAASGVGQGSLYHHFAGKKQLALAAISEVEAELLAGLDAIFKANIGPKDQIIQFLSKPRGGLKGCKIGRLAQEASIIQDEEMGALVARYFDTLLDILAEKIVLAQQEGTIEIKFDPRQLAHVIVATIQGGFVLSRGRQDPNAIDSACHGLISLLE